MADTALSTLAYLDTLLWQAAHPGEDPAARDAAYDAALSRLDAIVAPACPADDAGYRRLTQARDLLGSLYCYAFSRGRPEFRAVSALEAAFAAVQARYNRRFLATDPLARLVARGHLWRYALSDPDRRALWVLARQHGVLAARRHPTTGLLHPRIIGLDRSMGDNTFACDAKGRQRRRHLRTIGRQTFHSERELPSALEDAQAFLATVPELDDLWSDVSVGDHKHGATGSRIGAGDQHRLYHALMAVPGSDLDAALPRRLSRVA